MRPVPIPEAVAAAWGGSRVVFSAPNGDLTDDAIRPVEAMVAEVDGVRVVSVRCEVEDGDLSKLEEGGHVWISFLGGLPPFMVDVSEAPL